jgi:autophagy-related protein 2
MAYFIPSYIQKRLLRYALARLELLDSEALDLDNLDIALGKRSTVELRDIGLRIPVSVRYKAYIIAND